MAFFHKLYLFMYLSPLLNMLLISAWNSLGMKRQINDSVAYSTLKAFQRHLAQLLENKIHINWPKSNFFVLLLSPTLEDGKYYKINWIMMVLCRVLVTFWGWLWHPWSEWVQIDSSNNSPLNSQTTNVSHQPSAVNLDECVHQCCKDGSISEQAIDTKLTDVQGYLFLSLLLSQQREKNGLCAEKNRLAPFFPLLVSLHLFPWCSAAAGRRCSQGKVKYEVSPWMQLLNICARRGSHFVLKILQWQEPKNINLSGVFFLFLLWLTPSITHVWQRRALSSPLLQGRHEYTASRNRGSPPLLPALLFLQV